MLVNIVIITKWAIMTNVQDDDIVRYVFLIFNFIYNQRRVTDPPLQDSACSIHFVKF